MYGEFEIDQYRSVVTDFTLYSSELMNTFELEKVLNTFKPPGWDTGVFPRNEQQSNRKMCLYFNTDYSHNEGTHWVALSINDQGEGLYFDSYGLPPVFKEFSTFLKVMFALTMMFNCKDLSHWPVDITVHYLSSTPLLDAEWRQLSTGWRNTVMTRLTRTNIDEILKTHK